MTSPGGYTPTTASAAATGSSSSLSGAGGTSAFMSTLIAVTPGAPGQAGARDTSAATRNDPDYAGARPTQPTMPQTKSVADLIADLYRMPKGDLEALQTRLKQAGYGNVTATGLVDQSTTDAYQALLRDTAAYQAFDTRGLGAAYTPDSFLNQKIASSNAQGQSVSGQALSDSFTARSLIISSLQSKLGRTPDPTEIAQFTGALKSYEQTSTNPDPGAFADAYPTSTQAGADQQGAQNEVGFMKVLSSLVGVK